MKKTTPPLLLTALLLLLPLLCPAQESDIPQLIQAAQDETTNGSSPGQVLARWLRVDDAIQKNEQKPMMEVAMAIAKIYRSEELYEQALPYYLQAWKSIPSNNKLDTKTIELYEQLGETYAQLAKPDSAYFFYNQLFEKYEQQNNKDGQLAVLQKIINSYADNDRHEMALEYNLQLKGLIEQQNRPDQEKMRIYNNLGYTYNQLKLYDQAILYFERAKGYLHKENRKERVIMDVNIGIAYYNLGKFNDSIKFLREAQKTKEKYDPKGIDEIEHLISTVYFRKKDYYNALLFSDESTQLAAANQNDALLTDIYFTTALIHSELYEYDLALDYFQKHLRLRDSFELEERFRRQQLLQQKLELERSEKQTKLRISNEELQKLTIEQLKTEKENQQLELDKQTALLATQQKEKELLKKENEIKASKIETQELETERAKQELELARQRLLASEEAQKVAVLQKDNELSQLALARSADSLATEQKERQLISKEKELTDLELQQQKEQVQNFYKYAILGGLITLIIAGGFLYSRKLNRQLNQKNAAIEKQKEEISNERNKSDQLLLNILPAETAQELKEKGTAIPKRYDNATVIFTDFSGFTRIASTMSPEQLIEELNYCFRHFDTILEKYGLEKIKTIGDAYMCVAGVPSPLEQHATRSIQAGQEIVAFMNQRIKEKKEAGQEYWNMRMGMHSGPVVAGVVGKKKFAYDIWGDTVNVASRMESNGEVGRINISEATYDLVKSKFDCEHRGKIHAKNVGEVSMYFVKG